MIGKKLLHYKILEKLGEGGMGIVYKAEDTKLKRHVALKFLPTNMLQGEAEKSRFLREAQAAAALNHANIAHIYAIEEVDDPGSAGGQVFIAMEYVEGRELTEIVGANGGSPLKMEEAIDYTTQIAAGLQSAHEKGVVHRDIKSANIMVTAKGQIKIMDFGLAKLTDRTKMTMEGTTLGTVAYMSPEQAGGEDIDQRSDIWSLGVVLYEMISGQLPFKGAHDAAVIYSIMNEKPQPLTALRSNLPIELDGIIFKALVKDPALRYQHVDELPADLKSLSVPSRAPSRIGTSRISGTIAQEKNLHLRVRYSWKTILMIAVPVLITFLLTWFLRPAELSPPPKALNKMTVELPQDVGFAFSSSNRMAISADGTRMVHMMFQTEPPRRLFMKKADSYEMTEVAGSERATAPFFSPDGRWIGYFDGQKEKICKIPADGGEPLEITAYKDVVGIAATWARDNSIIFSGPGGLSRVSASGGEPLMITKTRSADEQLGYPCMLPDGKSVLFTVIYKGTGLDSCRLAVYSFGDDDYRIIPGINGYNALYSHSGHILYGSSGQLMGVPFDLKSLEVTGQPVPVLDNVKTDWETGSMSYALSGEGTLIFVPRKEDYLRWISYISLSGLESAFLDMKKYFMFTRYAPNARYVAFIIWDIATNIWIYDTDGGALNPLTFYKDNGTNYFAWSPDSRRIAYATRDEDSTNSIYIKRIDGSGSTKKIYTAPSEGFMSVTDWSADGNFLTIFQFDNGNSNCFIYSFQDSTVKPLLNSPANEGSAQFSPNSKWILFNSSQSGITEVYVRPFPDVRNGVWKISEGRGYDPLWSPDGRKIYYRRQNEMYAVDVTTGAQFSKGTPRKIFEGDYFNFSGGGRRFDIHPDGERFIMIQQPGGTNNEHRIFVIQNIFEELKRLMPAKEN